MTNETSTTMTTLTAQDENCLIQFHEHCPPAYTYVYTRLFNFITTNSKKWGAIDWEAMDAKGVNPSDYRNEQWEWLGDALEQQEYSSLDAQAARKHPETYYA